MDTYLSNAQSTVRKLFLFLFGIVVVAFNIIGLVNTKNRMKKLGFDLNDNDGKEVVTKEPKNKKEQIKKPLIDSREGL